MFCFRKVQREKKNSKENGFLTIDITLEKTKEIQIYLKLVGK